MKYIVNIFKRFSRNERGTATIEFVFVFPLMFAMLAAMFDAGLIMVKYVVLETSLDRVVRNVRLNGIAGGETGSDFFKDEICNISPLFVDCQNSLFVEMTPINTGSTFIPAAPTCIDRTAENTPAIVFVPGVQNEIVYIRACVIVDRYLPSTLLGIFTPDASGGIRLVADSAYVVEP